MKISATLMLILIFFTTRAQDSTLKQYVGKYSFPEGSPVTSAEVVLTGSELSVNSSAGASLLEKRGTDTFYLQAYDGLVFFLRNTEGKISGMKVDVHGNVFEGTRDVVARRNRTPMLHNRRMMAK